MILDFFDIYISISIVVGALYGLSLRLQQKFFERFHNRPSTFFYAFSLVSIVRMILVAWFIYNILHMNYLKGILNGIICIVTLFVLMQKKA
jgi:hypothetical protein